MPASVFLAYIYAGARFYVSIFDFVFYRIFWRIIWRRRHDFGKWRYIRTLQTFGVERVKPDEIIFDHGCTSCIESIINWNVHVLHVYCTYHRLNHPTLISVEVGPRLIFGLMLRAISGQSFIIHVWEFKVSCSRCYSNNCEPCQQNVKTIFFFFFLLLK